MSAPARLLALRLHGFKSFAERTIVEFGPGISAIVGPNGSGKSNLADGLRWALGEQGRSLRTRRAEDVIWAGSERRAAQGMADVTLLLDNGDGLLPVDFTVVELGRRLYRSGENDYLLNRQRVRLKDMVDLLDAGHLADNAFLFIGQGMVDQALSLRPEERRPLFEEVAGVRRHERRRKRAEEQLAESLANLARVEDILAELRPQARRLAAQVEQQASRQSAAEDLADALLLGAHARWHDASQRARRAAVIRARARDDADRGLAALTAAEEEVVRIAANLADRAALERDRRTLLEAAVANRNALGLRQARMAAELESVERDRERLGQERASVASDVATQERLLVTPVPARDHHLEAELAEADRSLAEAAGELATLRAADRARDEGLGALRRAEAARAAELETARRRLADAERHAVAELEQLAAAAERIPAAELGLGVARDALAAAISDERAATVGREAAGNEMETADAVAASARARAVARSADVAARRGRLDALAARLAEEEARGIARAARRRGGRRLDDGLVVEPGLRAAVQAALAETARAYLVQREVVGDLGAERGVVVVGDVSDRGVSRAAEAAERRLRDVVAGRGGGILDAAVRRDPVGGARRLLARAAWLPTLADCLAIQEDLPPGWVAVPHDGTALVTDLTVALGAVDATLDRRAERETLALEVATLETGLAEAQAAAATAAREAASRRAAVEVARAAESAAVAARRRAEEAERQAARTLEGLLREHAWHAGQAARMTKEQERLAAALVAMEAAHSPVAGIETDRSEDERVALASWEERAADLRARRARLASQVAAADGARREAEARRSRAEATIAVREERLAWIDRELVRLADLEQEHAEARGRLGREAAEAAALESDGRRALDALLGEDRVDHEQLAEAERRVAALRERLRALEDEARAAERSGMEAELGLESLREQLLADLTGLGEIALQRLPRPVDEAEPPNQPAGTGPAMHDVPERIWSESSTAYLAGDDDGGRLARALEIVTRRWVDSPAPPDAPGPGRLASLRRRYLELGAGNPFASGEYDELKARLDEMEAQHADLGRAIERTRTLIEELGKLVTDQFRTTFRALETAFDERFQQLFGGGFARLELTDPGDIAASGIEITARPPGKRRQPLAMLSGGERSLTAVALLLAMLQVRPVPFCVLDEVDAALDEANVGRFTSALQELAQRTQFIVITHNRGTIRAADALYGVTVGDDSVSRVISLRLDEANAVATRGEHRRPVADPVVDAVGG